MSHYSDDEAAERIRQEIREAFALDSMSPAEKAAFDAYGRIVEALRADQGAFVQAMYNTAERFAEHLTQELNATVVFQPDPDDRLPRRRNPRIGCEEHASGTWIHGDPHDCPRWTRR